jgi:hypothetical protein
MERYNGFPFRPRHCGGAVLDEPAFDGPTQPAVIIAGHMGVRNSMKHWDHFRTLPRTRPCREGNHTRRNCRNANRPCPPRGRRSSGSVSKYPVHLQKLGIRLGARLQCDLSPHYTIQMCKKSYIRAIDVGSFLTELSPDRDRAMAGRPPTTLCLAAQLFTGSR